MKPVITRGILSILLALASLAPISGVAQTVTYSLADDFSYTTNLAGSTWSYRLDDWQNVPPRFLPLLTSTNHDANELWGTDFPNPPVMWSDDTNHWAIGRNLTGAEQYSPITGTTWSPGDVLFWPKGGGTPPARMVIAWTSPHKGMMNVDYTFDRASEIGNGIGYSLLYRKAGIDTDLVGFIQVGVSFTESHTGLQVNKGDQLFFRFDTWGPSTGDISRANIVITVTPDTYSQKPEIITHPAGGTGYLGLEFTFTVQATDADSYEWRKDGDPIAGATKANYTIGTLSSNDAGAYTVVVSNPLGAATSHVAMLEVVPATLQPVYSLADDFSIVSNGGSSPWAYGQDIVGGDPVQFLPLTTNTRNANDLWGTTFANPPTMWSDAEGYWGIGKNASGVVQTSTSGITWNPNEVLLRPRASAPFPGRLVIRYTAPGNFLADISYRFERALEAGSVGYSLVKRTSAGDAYLVGWTGQTSVAALSNTLTTVTLSRGDQLFWRIDSWGGTVEDDITKASIVIAQLQFQSKPEILTQPSGGVGFLELPFTFSVTATNAESFQWLKGGEPISAATLSTYTIETLQAGDAGDYSVLVSNPLGSVTSHVATLQVAAPVVVATTSLAGGFSITNNGGDNPWAYGYDSIPGEPVQFVAHTNNTQSANELWSTDFANPPLMWSSDLTEYGGIGINQSGVVQTSSSGITWNPGEVLLRPKATGTFPGRSVIRWTAPANLTVNLLFTFERALNAGSVGYSLVKRTSAGDAFLVGWTGQTSLGVISNFVKGVSLTTGDQLFWRIDSWGAVAEDDITRAAIDLQVLGAAPQAPSLIIEYVASQNAVVVSWPSSASGYTLQSSGAVSGPFGPYDGTITTSENQFSTTVPVGSTNRFFRLMK